MTQGAGMKKIISLISFLVMLVGMVGAQQLPPTNKTYITPRAFMAQKPDGSWTFLEVDNTGGLVGAGGGFALLGQQPPPTNAFLFPEPLIAQDPSGNWQFLQVDGTGALKTTGGGGSVTPGGNPDALQYNVANSSLGGLNSPTTNGNCIVSFNVTANAAVVPTCQLAGVSVNAQSGNYSLQYTDRAVFLKVAGGTSSTITLCQITGTCANNYPLVVQNQNTGDMSLCPNAADSIDGATVGTCTTVASGYSALVYQDSTSAPGHWWTIKFDSVTTTNGIYVVQYSGSGANSAGTTVANATRLWSYISPQTVVNSTNVIYAINIADNTANLYNLALFDTLGNIVCQTGAVAGTSFAPATGQRTLVWAAPCSVYANRRYYIGITGTVGTAALGGSTLKYSKLCFQAASANNTTASAVWTTPIGIPADSVNLSCTDVIFGVAQ